MAPSGVTAHATSAVTLDCSNWPPRGEHWPGSLATHLARGPSTAIAEPKAAPATTALDEPPSVDVAPSRSAPQHERVRFTVMAHEKPPPDPSGWAITTLGPPSYADPPPPSDWLLQGPQPVARRRTTPTQRTLAAVQQKGQSCFPYLHRDTGDSRLMLNGNWNPLHRLSG